MPKTIRVSDEVFERFDYLRFLRKTESSAVLDELLNGAGVPSVEEVREILSKLKVNSKA